MQAGMAIDEYMMIDESVGVVKFMNN